MLYASRTNCCSAASTALGSPILDTYRPAIQPTRRMAATCAFSHVLSIMSLYGRSGPRETLRPIKDERCELPPPESADPRTLAGKLVH